MKTGKNGDETVTNDQAFHYGIEYAKKIGANNLTGKAARSFILDGMKEHGIDPNGDDPLKEIFLASNFGFGFRQVSNELPR